MSKHLSALEVSKEFYNLFFRMEKNISIADYLNNSYCDELMEVNLKKNSCLSIFGVYNKYSIPETDGTFTSLNQFVIDNIVHPDDVEIYRDLMDPDTILEKLHNSVTHNFRFAHFRYKMLDGSYRWVEQVILTGEENEIEDGCFRIYVFDIQNAKIREEGKAFGDESYSLLKDIDQVTGLYTQHAFYKKAKEFLKKKKLDHYCILCMDIDHFKLFDEWYGRSKGDYLLSKLGLVLVDFAKKEKSIAGYFGQDDFVLVTKNNPNKINALFNLFKETIDGFSSSSSFLPCFGIAKLDNDEKIEHSYDKASVASYHAKNDVRNRIKIYDPSFHEKTEIEYRLLNEFMEGMKKDEITFYLQPQVRVSTGQIVGAEALCRWIKEDGKMVPPAEFIPILEKYSFIPDLDKRIWEKVIIFIKSLLDQGIEPVPISVNVSRIDIFTFDVAAYFKQLLDKYELSPSYLKVEVTESAYSETTVEVKALTKALRDMGILVMMDDFGAGYSSLNMLSDIEVDAIKLDAMFLSFSSKGETKGVRIVESVVNMAKLISLPIVVEGVENKKQKQFLEELGCRYIQGFYFYKPMCIDDFIDLIVNPDKVDYQGILGVANQQFGIREFLDKTIYSDTMLNNIIGPAALYAWKGKTVNIVRYNQQFKESVDTPDFNQKLMNIERVMPPEDRMVIYTAFKNAIKDKINGSSAKMRFYKLNGTLTSYSIRFYYLGMKEGYQTFFGSAENITAITDLEEQMRLIAKYSSSTIIFLKRRNEKWEFNVASNGLGKVFGLGKEEIEKEFNNRSFLNRLSPEAKDSLIKIFNEARTEKKTRTLNFEYYNKYKDKTYKINAKADPIIEEANNIEYIISLRLL